MARPMCGPCLAYMFVDGVWVNMSEGTNSKIIVYIIFFGLRQVHVLNCRLTCPKACYSHSCLSFYELK